MEQSESNQIPRLRTVYTGWIRSEQMTTYLGESSGACRPEEHHITSVLLAFNWIRLLNIQSLMASTHFEFLAERHVIEIEDDASSPEPSESEHFLDEPSWHGVSTVCFEELESVSSLLPHLCSGIHRMSQT